MNGIRHFFIAKAYLYFGRQSVRHERVNNSYMLNFENPFILKHLFPYLPFFISCLIFSTPFALKGYRAHLLQLLMPVTEVTILYFWHHNYFYCNQLQFCKLTSSSDVSSRSRWVLKKLWFCPWKCVMRMNCRTICSGIIGKKKFPLSFLYW